MVFDLSAPIFLWFLGSALCLWNVNFLWHIFLYSLLSGYVFLFILYLLETINLRFRFSFSFFRKSKINAPTLCSSEREKREKLESYKMSVMDASSTLSANVMMCGEIAISFLQANVEWDVVLHAHTATTQCHCHLTHEWNCQSSYEMSCHHHIFFVRISSPHQNSWHDNVEET